VKDRPNEVGDGADGGRGPEHGRARTRGVGDLDSARRVRDEEAVRLTQLLIQNPGTSTPDTQALFALMLFHAGRLQARVNSTGGLVLLDEQDRDQWDWSLIKTGFSWLERSAQGQVITKYHLEAAIAAEHCQALSFDQTNWQRIDELYELLYRMEPTAIHALNRSIALAYLHGPRAGINWLSKLHPDGAPPGYHHWPAVLGELHRRQGELQKAMTYFDQALAMSPPPAEKQFLEMRRRQCVTNETEAIPCTPLPTGERGRG